MRHEIITDPLDHGELWADLRTNAALLDDLGVRQIWLLFGFAWGNSIYPAQWTDIPAAPDEIAGRIREAEQKGFGRLGSDNLYIGVPDLNARLQYSHEAEIHLSYLTVNPFVQTLYDRWSANQWFLESKKNRI